MLLFLPLAHAFCGAYVGPPGESLTNRGSRVTLARTGSDVTLTLASDYTGDSADFGLVIPVPEVLGAEDVSVLDPQVFDDLDAATAPRLVAYTCDDLVTRTRTLGPGCDGESDSAAGDSMVEVGGGVGAGGVTVEAAFAVANYDIVVLSADGGVALQAWLTQHGYAMPAGGEEVLQSYIDGGASFLAAKVTTESQGEGLTLPPLQLKYSSPGIFLPIRIGTLAADGMQEVLLTVFTRTEVKVANLPEATVEDDCLLDEAGWGDAYMAEVDALSPPFFLTEYSWDLQQACDPCVPFAANFVDAATPLGGGGAEHLTRLRIRYRPEDATEDLTLYETGEHGASGQIRYIVHDPDLEGTFPVCGQGYVDGGTCMDGDQACNTADGTWGPLAALGAVLAVSWRRRCPR